MPARQLTQRELVPNVEGVSSHEHHAGPCFPFPHIFMRSLLTLTLALGLTGVVYAQSTSTTIQSGTGHTITLDQSGVADAYVEQSGSFNNAGVYQDGTAIQATVIQTGARNLAFVDQGVFTFPGIGDSDATIEQPGTDNVGYVLQGDGNSLSGTVYQAGVFGDAEVRQSGLGHVGTVDQLEGTNNVGYTSQLGGAFNEAGIVQDGDDNDATITQTGNEHTATVKQVGDRNVSTITQDGFNNRAADRTTRGNDNVLTIDQIDSDNIAVSHIWGDRNTITVTQSGNNQEVDLDGRRNTTAPVLGVNDNVIDFDQAGGDNFIGGWLEDGASGNMITVSQDGSNNSVSGGPFGPGLYVEGDMNTITITQTGVGNTANAAALGDGNSVTITQF